ncbi:MAG: universal stress protein [Myxococcales bacterium]|nr:universal stress protein [Myxococcales bacterium]
MPRIVVAASLVDSEPTLRAGLELGERFRAQVNVVTVTPVRRLASARAWIEDLEAAEQRLETRTRAFVDAGYRFATLPIRVTVLEGSLISVLVRHVETSPTRLLVVGAGAQRPWWALGSSVATAIARAVSCPVYLAR